MQLEILNNYKELIILILMHLKINVLVVKKLKYL